MRYPKLSEKIHSERNYLRCKADWVARAVELEKEVAMAERRGFEACRDTVRGMCDDFARLAEECGGWHEQKAWLKLRDTVANMQPPESKRGQL